MDMLGNRVARADAPGHLVGDGSTAAALVTFADRSELATIAVERTRMPMIVTDPHLPDNPIVMANAAFLTGTGFSIDEVIGRNCRFLQGVDTDPASVLKIRAAIRDERDLTIELLNYRKDGGSFWNELHLSPIHDHDGRLVYFFASQLDVSERRRMHDLEAAEYAMLREIEHRARNALALVQGIVRLSQGDNVADYSQRVQGRIDVLSRAHSVLAEVRWRDVPLDRLIRAEVEPFGLQHVRLDGPPVTIPAAQVQPLALVLHEAIANAAHHGALSKLGGVLSISWRSDADWTHIELIERGGPPPAADRIAGFGVKIIDAIVRRQLHGRVEFDWTRRGLLTTLSLPTAAAAPV